MYCWQSDTLELQYKEEEHKDLKLRGRIYLHGFHDRKKEEMACDTVVCTFVKVFGWEVANLFFYLWFKIVHYFFTTYNHPITSPHAVYQLWDQVFLIFNMYSYQAVLEILQLNLK
jgi:hypothetical protein